MILRKEKSYRGFTAYCKCDGCGKIFKRKLSELNNSHYCNSQCFYKNYKRKRWNGERRGSNNPNWKGGRFITANGYVFIHKPEYLSANINGYVQEHRLVMEQYLGRYLKLEEDIHHINGIRDDNRIENLMLFENKSKHRKYEIKLKKNNSEQICYN